MSLWRPHRMREIAALMFGAGVMLWIATNVPIWWQG